MKTYLVTGASRGIGRHTVTALLEAGNRVIAVARSADKLRELETIADNAALITVQADITLEDGLNRIKAAAGAAGKIDGLVNNAGILINKPFLETSQEEWADTFNVNVFGAAGLVRVLHPYFSGNAHIVNIGSMGGFQGSVKYPGLAAYSASKGALAVLTECLSAELAQDGIAVNCLCIGAVETEMFREAFPGFEAPVRPEEMGAYLAGFVSSGHTFFNGKIIPVAVSNPK